MNKEKSEQLTKEEMDFLEEQHDIYIERNMKIMLIFYA